MNLITYRQLSSSGPSFGARNNDEMTQWHVFYFLNTLYFFWAIVKTVNNAAIVENEAIICSLAASKYFPGKTAQNFSKHLQFFGDHVNCPQLRNSESS